MMELISDLNSVLTLSSLSWILLLFLSDVSSSTANFTDRYPHCPAPLTSLTLSWSSLKPYLWRENFNTTPPDGELTPNIEAAARYCCPLINITYSQLNITSSNEIEIAIRKQHGHSPKLYFPVFANRNEEKQFGRDFIPLFESPGMIVLEIGKTDLSSIDLQAWKSLLSVWPNVVELILAATISGIIMWMLESRKNDDFSGSFFSGTAAGIWWSFVTMTTVGYGDKSPKSLIGRVFAVFWMIIGTISLSMFSARITTQLAKFEMKQEIDLVDAKVAVPLGMQNFLENELNLGAKYKEFDNRIILNRVANPTANHHPLSDSMKYAIVHDLDILQINFYKANQSVDIRIKKTIDHRLSLGMVMAPRLDHMKKFIECWKKGIIDRVAIEKAESRSFYREVLEPEEQEPESLLYESTVTYLAVSIGILFLLGSLWELLGKLRKKHVGNE